MVVPRTSLEKGGGLTFAVFKAKSDFAGNKCPQPVLSDALTSIQI